MEWLIRDVVAFAEATKIYFAFDTARLAEPGMVFALGLQALLFTLSAFFSGSETALFSLSRLDLQKLRRDRHPQSETLHALLDQPRSLIISILCGNEVVNIAATANLAGILVSLYGEGRAGWINVIVMFPMLLLLGEVTPKTIAASNPVSISAGLVARPMSLWVRFVTPLRRIVRLASDAITTWIVGKELARENILQVDEFRSILADVAEEGVLDATERVLIDNLLEAGETEIVEIMTPRTRIKFLKDDMSVPEVIEAFKQHKHPRVPVCHDHHDALVGFVHAEDILRLILDNVDASKLKLEAIMHPPVVVPPTKYVDEMFDFFQANNARAAVVLNEFGGVEGFITMRDIIRFIFGEISENVTGQELYQVRDKDDYVVPGSMKLTDFDDLTNFGIEDPRMTTIGGVVFRYLDRLPIVGDQVAMEGLVATVIEMDGHRLAKVRINKGVLNEPSGPSETLAVERADTASDQELLGAWEESDRDTLDEESGEGVADQSRSDEPERPDGGASSQGPVAKVIELKAPKTGKRKGPGAKSKVRGGAAENRET